MTTIRDPNGTPTHVFNRDGTAIVPVSFSGSGQDPDFQLPNRLAQLTVYEIEFTNPNPGQGSRNALLPSNAEIGDEVQILFLPDNEGTPSIGSPSGETIVNGQTETSQPVGSRTRFLKVRQSRWHTLF